MTHDAVRPWPFQSEMLTHTPTGLGSFPYADGQVGNGRGHVFLTFPSLCRQKVRFCFFTKKKKGEGNPSKLSCDYFFTKYKSKILNISGHHFGGFGSMYAGIKY